jgi:hypothetical protein
MTVLSSCLFNRFCFDKIGDTRNISWPPCFLALVFKKCLFSRTPPAGFYNAVSCTKFNIRHTLYKYKNNKVSLLESCFLGFCYEKMHKTKLCRRLPPLLTRCRFLLYRQLAAGTQYSKRLSHIIIIFSFVFLLDFPASFSGFPRFCMAFALINNSIIRGLSRSKAKE